MVGYEGIPKKRGLYLDDARRGGDAKQVPLDKRSGASHYQMVASSGTLLEAGHLTITGAQFKPTSVVTASYNETVSGTQSIGICLDDSTATFRGDSGADFYYIMVNLSV